MLLPKGTLGNAIRAARIKKNLSQEALAEMIGITPTHLKHIESEHRNPSIDILFKLAEVLTLSLDSLLFPTNSDNDYLFQEINNRLNKCTKQELQIVLDLINSLHEHR